MTSRIETLYFDWLIDHICDEHDIFNYENLLWHLFYRDFVWIRPLDKNCAIYGCRLRDDFMDECSSARRIMSLNNPFMGRECSILELIVSLAIRMEDMVMSNDVFGDRTGYWFWLMIDNLGLGNMVNSQFDSIKVDNIIDNFLNRTYEKNGKGGLFVINDKNIDMRNCDIWQQSMGFLRKFVENDGEIY